MGAYLRWELIEDRGLKRGLTTLNQHLNIAFNIVQSHLREFEIQEKGVFVVARATRERNKRLHKAYIKCFPCIV